MVSVAEDVGDSLAHVCGLAGGVVGPVGNVHVLLFSDGAHNHAEIVAGEEIGLEGRFVWLGLYGFVCG